MGLAAASVVEVIRSTELAGDQDRLRDRLLDLARSLPERAKTDVIARAA